MEVTTCEAVSTLFMQGRSRCFIHGMVGFLASPAERERRYSVSARAIVYLSLV